HDAAGAADPAALRRHLHQPEGTDPRDRAVQLGPDAFRVGPAAAWRLPPLADPSAAPRLSLRDLLFQRRVSLLVLPRLRCHLLADREERSPALTHAVSPDV